MNRIYLLILTGIGLILPIVHAQHGLNYITKESIHAQLSFLASDALQGRQSGTIGGQVAAEYLKSQLQELGIKPLYENYFQPFEAYSPIREKRMDFVVHPDSIAKYKQESSYRRLDLRNVIGYIPGRKTDEYIVIGAHYDHVGIDELLVGTQIYNGADDNAASVVAVLQIAKVYAALAEKPERSIIFAFWDGEEVNYLGSEYFAANFQPISGVKTYINLDMIAREGYVPILYPEFAISRKTAENSVEGNRFHLLYTEEITPVSSLLDEKIKNAGLNVESKHQIIEHGSDGSDHLSFSLRKIPVLWFFTGLHPDYHTPHDEVEKIDLDKLTDITKAIYLSVETLVNK